MTQRKMDEDDPSEDFKPREITLNDAMKRVYVAGVGPAVIVMTEMPGISPHVALLQSLGFGDAGFTVYMPSLFGRDGAVPTVEEGKAISKRACVSARVPGPSLLNQLKPGGLGWLRPLAKPAHAEVRRSRRRCNLALALPAISPSPSACSSRRCSRLSSPSRRCLVNDPGRSRRLPRTSSPRSTTPRAGRSDRHGLSFRAAIGSAGGSGSQPSLQHLAAEFIAPVLPDSAGTPDTPLAFFRDYVACPHSVVTAHLIDEAGQPTIAARDEILSFFTRRLSAAGSLKS